MPRIEIDNLNVVKIWLEETDKVTPDVYQPTWPDGSKWASLEQANTWAESLVEAYQDPNSPFIPGDTPGQPIKPRPEDK